MKMKALDSFYSSQTKQVRSGDEFEVSDEVGKSFETRGLAERLTDDTEKVRDDPDAGAKLAEKAKPSPLNKMAAPTANKAAEETPSKPHAARRSAVSKRLKGAK